MAHLVQDSPFFSPGSIEYQDTSGVPIPSKNLADSQIVIRWGAMSQVVTFNSDGQPLTASLPATGVSP